MWAGDLGGLKSVRLWLDIEGSQDQRGKVEEIVQGKEGTGGQDGRQTC